MLTLGFTNKFYTLWNVTEEIVYGAGEVMNGKFTGSCWKQTRNQFYRNLSTDYETAIEKIKKCAGGLEWVENLNLRGVNGSFTTREFIGGTVYQLEDYEFSFGKLYGKDIREAVDVWQLTRAMEDEQNLRRRVHARKRLIELGELTPYQWTESLYDHEATVTLNGDNCELPPVLKDVKRKYATPLQVVRFESEKDERKMSGHFFTDGDKINIQIKKTESFSFDTRYGTTVVEKYLTPDGKVVKYMGSSPPFPPISKEEFTTVSATIKHSEYKGALETKLQRIKIKYDEVKI